MAEPVEISRACGCGSNQMTIGQARSSDGRTIYPYVCSACGAIQTQYASKKAADACAAANGALTRVQTKTEAKGRAETLGAQAEARQCEVCGAGHAQRHHWAPWYLFGDEAERWPTSLLCQACHTRWHQLVTPGMGKPSP